MAGCPCHTLSLRSTQNVIPQLSPKKRKRDRNAYFKKRKKREDREKKP
jgi:hypothetical protein